jgi:hypothetical protein
MIITLASIGLPGLNGFIGEFLILLGAFRWNPRFCRRRGAGRDSVGGLHALDVPARVLRSVTHEENATLPDVQPREWAGMLPLCAMALVMGIFPTLFLRPMETSVTALVQRVQQYQDAPGRKSGCSNSSLDAIVPMLCVTLAALAVMGAEAFRGRDENMPLGGSASSAWSARRFRRPCSGTATPPASASLSPTTSACS